MCLQHLQYPGAERVTYSGDTIGKGTLLSVVLRTLKCDCSRVSCSIYNPVQLRALNLPRGFDNPFPEESMFHTYVEISDTP